MTTRSTRKPSETDATDIAPSTGVASEAEVAELAPDEDLDIEALSKVIGKTTETELACLVGETSDGDLIARGREVDTKRISDDGARILRVAHAFFASASTSTLNGLALTPDVVRIAAWSCAQGHLAWRRVRELRARRRGHRRVSTVRNRAILNEARVEWASLADSLRKVVPGDAVELVRIESATHPKVFGEVETGPGQVLASLVKIGREYLTRKDDGTRARCGLWRLTTESLDRCAKSAANALAVERAENVPSVDAVAYEQNLLDRWDGINLLLLGAIVRAFANGHARNGLIPKLRVVSLRGVIGGHRRPRK